MFPREKFLKKGIDNLTDMDLIAILVGSGIKGKDFISVARSVVRRIKENIREKEDIKLEDMLNINGVGEVTGMRILCGIELGRRLYDLGNEEKLFVKNTEDAYIILKDIGLKKQEYVVAIFLNSRFEVLDKKVICIGSFDGVTVLPRDIIIPALELNASSVVIAHNHPSGDPTPSNQDIHMTKRIKEGLDLVGLNLLDHIVITKQEWKRIDI